MGAGSQHTVAAAATQSLGSGSQLAFSTWSDGGALSHTVTAPSAATTYTAAFLTQYALITVVNPSGAGAVTPSGGWYNAGTQLSVNAAGGSAPYSFGSFSGALSGGATPQNLTMAGPLTVTANFVAWPTTAITVNPAAASVTVNAPTGGQGYNGGNGEAGILR